MTSTPRDTKGKSRSKDWHIRYLPETDDISPEALSSLKCPFDTIPKPKDSVPAEFTENIRHLLSSQETGALSQTTSSYIILPFPFFVLDSRPVSFPLT